MCKEDVRIKRQTDTNTFRAVANNAAIAQAFKANPLRCSLIVAFENNTAGVVGGYALIRAGNKSSDPIIATIGPGNMSAVVTIEQVGQAVTREVWFQGNDAGAPIVVVTEVFFTEGW